MAHEVRTGYSEKDNRQLRQAAGPTANMNETEHGGEHTEITARYEETEHERVLSFERDEKTAVLAQNTDGYAMITVRPSRTGEELERYYGFEMALDHAAERLDVTINELPIPEQASDMGM